MFLKVYPLKNILYFGRKGKLNPKFISPYEILERVGLVVYRLALPLELAKLHDVFHVSMLQRYHSDTSHILLVQDIQVQEYFTFDEEMKDILDREIRQLRNKQVPLVKVLWQHHGMEEVTWEPGSTMRYSTLDSSVQVISRTKFILRGGGGGGGGGERERERENCNTPKYTLVIFKHD